MFTVFFYKIILATTPANIIKKIFFLQYESIIMLPPVKKCSGLNFCNVQRSLTLITRALVERSSGVSRDSIAHYFCLHVQRLDFIMLFMCV